MRRVEQPAANKIYEVILLRTSESSTSDIRSTEANKL
jgi:hypothetical protein